MPITANNIAPIIRDFLIDEVLEDDQEIEMESNLLTEMDVDSMGMLRLVNHIETAFSIKISPIYFTIENFQHISAISHFVARLLSEQQK